ncbi:NAD(P)/FAD-dependent oxidoreductase [Polymorphobacter sp. PAMC 29334]|uniref:NAD(P)/FAD-dependent oxidoreductase n=1 Tax=Polymorphobacter sp. PAMC 29334 TaxID=2862331 RepID=UPI001C67BC0F|nr:NAD(P)/FAD-dependent oxidoreductase [Polymorphobacter sp. PAMC 29334]QYE35538.1 NAD(P)/FAD-dependent oxidoreductase [Polymorphobacter sp. PAMC 29334]
MAEAEDCDVVIVGGGPAGLTAAIYLARFHLRTIVVDAGHSRAETIPLTRNHAGYPGGITGTALVAAMREQAVEYGASVVVDRVERMERDGDSFVAHGSAGSVRARAVLLATGVFNHRPAIDDALHDAALAAGALRYCPICDGYEVTDRKVGIIGTSDRGTKEALFLRGYTGDVTLVAADGPHDLTAEQRGRLADAGVVLIDGPAREFTLDADGLSLTAADGRLSFASVYPALGSEIHSELAEALGAKTENAGCVIVDTHQRTSIKGLYAAGDVVLGLDQISHAMGEGGVAATTIRNDLAEVRPMYR